MSSKLVSRACAALIALGVGFMALWPVAAIAALQTNYDWYRGHESDRSYAISTAGEMKALAKLVNGQADYDGDGVVDDAVDFAGKSITLGASVNFVAEGIEPIGSAQHPFKGSFDGAGNEVNNFSYVVSAQDVGMPTSDVGLFGYIGTGGSVSNLSVGSFASISLERDASSADYIKNVGLVAGYCAGSVANCSNAGSLTVKSTVAQASSDDFIPVRNIGGVAGQVIFDVTGCSNMGNVSVTQDSTLNVDVQRNHLAARIAGVVGLAGDEMRIGTFDKHVYGKADKHGAVSSCANLGMVSVETPQLGSLDRFGQQTNAESWAVGGVVGYSQGSVIDCVNGRARETQLGSVGREVGYVRAENGGQVGGICGSLRGVLSDNMNVAWADDGSDGADPLVMSGNTNYGDVYGRVTVGGIVGKASSYTTVTECLNLNKSDAFGNVVGSFVIATRWNKPSPGGIAGTANGEVSYCANLATIASAKWADEEHRTMKTQDGYYAAGIVGTLTYFGDQAEANGGRQTPVSELFSCYNAGTIVAGAGMRQRGIVGQNDGFVHDNVLLSGVVDDDKIAYGDSPGDKEASGTMGENRVYGMAELRGDASAAAVAFLNANSLANGWSRYWIVSRDAVARGLNGGYPLLDRQNPWSDATSIAEASLELVEDAAYTGGESTPRLKVTLGGRELVADAEYRVVAQVGAISPTTGRPYRAVVVGLGRYTGTSTASIAYGITAGDFSTCAVSVVAHTFDYGVQQPGADDVVVRTPAGTVVDPENYDFTVVDASDRPIEPVNADTYRLLVVPKPGSVLFKGTLEGTYRVKPASFMRDVKFEDAEISYLGKTYDWVDSKAKGESDNPSTTLPYTGVPVLPEVSGVTYKGHELVEGTDYKVVYGNASSDEGNTNSEEENNLGKAGGSAVGCVTVRYITGGKSNFSSYSNMFFNIVDDGEKVDLSKATYRVEGAQVADGMPLEPVELYLGSARLEEGVDYEIEYEDNVEPGTATFVATGVGSFTGELAGSFEIEADELVTLLYRYAGEGTDANPFVATVTGVEYHGNRERFSLVIPESVEYHGTKYVVRAIGEKAFGGSSYADFNGTLAAESKEKLASVVIPGSVVELGDYAFGSAWGSSDLSLAEVDFDEVSQLTSIGACAFAKCTQLKRIVLPEKVASIGNRAFYLSGLSELRFMTESAGLPSSVAEGAVNGSFRSCEGVAVFGYGSAEAVKELARANSGDKKDGSAPHANGGSGFTFTPLQSLQDAVVSKIADEHYTGDALRPSVRVEVGGDVLVEGTDFSVSYSDNVSAGTAHVFVEGIGRWAGGVETTFAIKPAQMSRVEFSALETKLYDGDPIDYRPRLTYLEHRLREGIDYELSYADDAGNPVDTPSKPGMYRLVATGKGSFEGTGWRLFRIAAASIADAKVDNVGQRDYTGVAIEPDPNVMLGGKYLERDVDYVLAYDNNVEVGDASLLVRGIGEYEGEQRVAFRIIGSPITGARIAGVFDIKATGDPIAFEPVVISGGKLLVEGKDYLLSYVATSANTAVVPTASGGSGLRGVRLSSNETETALDGPPSSPGTYKIVATGRGSYRGSASASFAIVEDDVPARTNLDGAVVTMGTSSFVYDGSACMPSVAVTLGGRTLEEGRDYLVSYRDNVMPTDRATATVHGVGDYEGSAAAVFEVRAADIEKEDVRPIVGAYYRGGSGVCPAVAVNVGARSLVEGLDYEVAYEANTAVGQGRAVITGRGGYQGQVTVVFDIARADISRASIEVADQTYNATALTPVPSVILNGVKLDASRDFTVSYADNIELGAATVTVYGQGSYTGMSVVSFAVLPCPVEGARITAPAQTYTGSELKPAVTVRVGSTVLGAADYDLAYASNVNAGVGVVTVTGKGNYVGSASQSFIINPADLSKASVSVAVATYTGSSVTPKVTVKLGGSTLKPTSQYKLAYLNSAKKAVAASTLRNAGTYYVKVTGTGNYAGSTTKAFAIARADLSKASVSVAAVTYTGKALKPAVTVKLSGKRLKPGTDYSLAYSNNVNASTSKSKAKVRVTGVGNYRSSVTAAFSVKAAVPVVRVKATSKTVKVKTVKKKAQTLKIGVSSPSSGKLSYAITKSDKRITFRNGIATLKKGAKKGTYSIKVKLSQAAKGNYAKVTKTFAIVFKVR